MRVEKREFARQFSQWERKCGLVGKRINIG